jgi:hypothetical protein
LQYRLAKFQIDDVIETNVICFGTPMAKDLAQCKPGMDRGREIFSEMIKIMRPKVLIVHGVGTAKELRRALFGEIAKSAFPKPATKKDGGVLEQRVPKLISHEPYKRMVLFIPSLAPPRWDFWKDWAPSHLEKACSTVRAFLDED